jgi:hypothetical protein
MPAAIDPTWPDIALAAWDATRSTLQLWMQIVGKIRLAQTPWLNHSWHVPLYLTARGLTTSPIPHGARIFEIQFDFLDHVLHIDTAEGARRSIALKPQTVADFHSAVMRTLAELELPVTVTDNRLQHRPCTRCLRCRVRPTLLARAAAGRPDHEAIPYGIHRQVQPRAFLLGQLRSGGDALLGQARTGIRRQGATCGRCDHARSLFT